MVCNTTQEVTAVGFEPTPFRNGALSHRLRPLGQTVLGDVQDSQAGLGVQCHFPGTWRYVTQTSGCVCHAHATLTTLLKLVQNGLSHGCRHLGTHLWHAR